MYRRGDANDPEIYVAGVTAVLSEFEPEVIRRVTDPREGIARQVNWMPTIAEVSKACEAKRDALDAERYLRRKGYVWDTELKKYVKTGGK